MKKQLLFAGTAILLALSSCNKNADCSGITVKDLMVDDFSRITLISDFDVTIVQSDSAYISLQGCTADLNRLRFENHNGHVELKRGNGKTSDEPIKVRIGIPELRLVETEGTVDVDIAGFTSPIDRSFKTRGTGTLKFNGIATLLTLNLDGTTKVDLSGSAYEVDADISGVTRLRAFDLIAKHYTIDISGTSEAQISVETSLNVKASGVSTVRYRGNPAVNIQTNETSKVIKD